MERAELGPSAWLTCLGDRAEQQDVVLVDRPAHGLPAGAPSIYGVFDGHGPDGRGTAEQAALALQARFRAGGAPAGRLPPLARILDAFRSTQAALIEVPSPRQA